MDSSTTIAPEALFSALSHPTRLRCLCLLARHDELCVCELTHAIGAAQPHISRHLGHLREAGLVQDRREGLWIHYRLHRGLPKWMTRVIRQTTDAVETTRPFCDDAAALAEIPNRPGAPRCA
jgi:ArsR family transcriptional regulator